MVKQGKFREDLYFRLANVPILHLPPLRERRADLAGFIQPHARRYQAERRQARHRARSGRRSLLVAADWPGNVRELENVLNRACILADGERITLADLPADITRIAPPAPRPTRPRARAALREQLRALEARLIARALQQANDDRRLAAERLGIGLSSLYRKLEELERMGPGVA